MSSVGVLFVLSSLNAVTWPNERERKGENVDESERDMGTYVGEQERQEKQKQKPEKSQEVRESSRHFHVIAETE